MRFLFPEFLYALSLVAIPVIIHLFNFRKFKKVYFSNVNFLKEVQIQTSSSQKLKELLILACRILAIIFLVLAFAQPYFQKESAVNAYQKSVVSFYLDNSYSMEAVNKNGTLLDEGKRKIKDLVAAYQLNDRFQLLTNNFDGKAQRLLTKEELLDALNDVKIAPYVRDFQAIINQQEAVLLKQQNSNRQAYLISDFQQQQNFKTPITKDSTLQLNLVPLLANNLPNISVDSVYFLSPIHKAKQSESLVVKLSNHSAKAVENIPLKLNINKVQKAIASVSIKPNSYSLDTLRFSDLSGTWQQAVLSIKDYPITFDDELNFVFELQKQLSVLAIYQDEPLKNIEFAYQTDAFFDFSAVNQSQINYGALATKQALILENLKEIPGGLAQQLKQYVQKGGSLSVFIPLNADLESYKKFLQNLGTDVPLALQKEILNVSKLNLQHPIFTDVFEGSPKNIDLPIAKSYFKSSNFSKTTKQVLMFGGNQGLFNNYQIGNGKVYISFLPLETEASNFVQHALFLPILFKTALLASNFNTLFYTIGGLQNVNLKNVILSDKEVLHVKGNGFDIIPSYQQSAAVSSIYFADQLNKPGFYNVFLKDSLQHVFALNEDRKESDLNFYNLTDLENIFQLSGNQIIESKEKITTQQIKEVNLGWSLWKLCLILTLVFLAAEVLLIRFFKNQYVKSKTIKY
ncbi:BatA domain-containing protein [Pedobacter alpinus]|uniref:BatA domain-containing protein n=1 Tax=Pedobacter alpinus TaxID=1590643 RepID=A0ABW5TSU5_9SPHI